MKPNPRIAFLGTGAQGASIAADFALAGPWQLTHA